MSNDLSIKLRNVRGNKKRKQSHECESPCRMDRRTLCTRTYEYITIITNRKILFDRLIQNGIRRMRFLLQNDPHSYANVRMRARRVRNVSVCICMYMYIYGDNDNASYRLSLDYSSITIFCPYIANEFIIAREP